MWFFTAGFPIASISSDGSCVITKPPNTGGCVSRGGVCEQLLYEIGDPRAYVLPDLAVDLTGVQVQDGPEGVKVTGARGLPPTNTYKVSLCTNVHLCIRSILYIHNFQQELTLFELCITEQFILWLINR